MPTNESGVVTAIRKALLREYPNAVIYNVHGGAYQEAGIPDLLLCVQGRFIGLEVKFQRPGESAERARNKASDRQIMQIARINAAGGTAAVVLSAQEALDVVARALDVPRPEGD